MHGTRSFTSRFSKIRYVLCDADTEYGFRYWKKKFHSVSENEAPDMNVHSLAGTAMEMKECCQYSTKQPRMASIHLQGTRNQPARKQENNAQLSVVRFRPSEHRLKYQYSSPPFFISLSLFVSSTTRTSFSHFTLSHANRTRHCITGGKCIWEIQLFRSWAQVKQHASQVVLIITTSMTGTAHGIDQGTCLAYDV